MWDLFKIGNLLEIGGEQVAYIVKRLHQTSTRINANKCEKCVSGSRCERRMMKIPFKPLSERMLQEPFWLGLITVMIVLVCIGLVWCAKRHFPEKLEKLLAEEADRSRNSKNSNHFYLSHISYESWFIKFDELLTIIKPKFKLVAIVNAFLKLQVLC